LDSVSKFGHFQLTGPAESWFEVSATGDLDVQEIALRRGNGLALRGVGDVDPHSALRRAGMRNAWRGQR